MKKILLIAMTLSLCGCGATGRLLGTITTLPIRAAGAVIGYDETNMDEMPDIDQAGSLHHSAY